MASAVYAIRDDRAFIRASGAETQDFLQGLLSQDVLKVTETRAAYGALLTPQGKFLHDLFLTLDGDGVVLECEADRADDLLMRLKRYRLRAKIDLDLLGGWTAAVLWGGDPLGLGDIAGEAKKIASATAYVDPRTAKLGYRISGGTIDVKEILKEFSPSNLSDYAVRRIALGVPEGSSDIVVNKGFLLESGFDELNGVDWEKGCYVGQELTARTRYRGLVKRRLMPVRIEGDAPEAGEALAFNGKNAGEMRGNAGDIGLALVRLDAWRAARDTGAPLEAGDARLWPEKPEWARFE